MRSPLICLLAVVVVLSCGSVQRFGQPATPTPGAGMAAVSGHVSWPDCSATASTCESVDGIPVHFADASVNRTFTAVSDRSGHYTIQVPPGSYVVIAGNADRSPYQRQITLSRGDNVKLDLPISLPTGA
jgi:hypothetical protein